MHKKMLIYIAMLFWILITCPIPESYAAFFPIKSVGMFYITATNPVEWFTSTSGVVEQQHISPQKFNMNDNNIVLISRLNHTVSDRWRNKPFLNNHDNFIIKLLTLGNSQSLKNLNAAYRLGCYVYPYSLFCYDYNTNEWHLLATNIDAPSMLVYGFSWIINTPQKLINKIGYIVDHKTEPSIFCLFDVIVNLASLIIEIPICVLGTIAGFFIAFIFSPIASIFSLIGMLYFLCFAIWTAFYELVAGLLTWLPFV